MNQSEIQNETIEIKDLAVDEGKQAEIKGCPTPQIVLQSSVTGQATAGTVVRDGATLQSN